MKFAPLLLLLVAAPVAPETQYMLYERPVLQAPANTAQACFPLSTEIFTHAAPQLADLRLYQDTTEVPYVLQVAAPADTGYQSIQPLNLGRRENQTVFDAVMPTGEYGDVQLELTAQDFIETVVVTGSHVQAGQATKLGAFTIFDLSKQKLGRSTVMHLPESDFRYLHFRISGHLGPEAVTGLSVDRLPAREPNYTLVAASSQVTQKAHQSVVEFTIPANVPVDRVVFTPGAETSTFSRDVSITVSPVLQQVPDDESVIPRPVTFTGNLLRVHRMEDGHRIDKDNLAVGTSHAGRDTSAKWTITIDNGDDAPLRPQSVRLEMLEHTLCFELAAGKAYTLYYGDESIPGPHYDYASLFRAQSDAARLALASEMRNPQYKSRPDRRPFTEKHPALLWGALVAVILLLASIALRSANYGKG